MAATTAASDSNYRNFIDDVESGIFHVPEATSQAANVCVNINSHLFQHSTKKGTATATPKHRCEFSNGSTSSTCSSGSSPSVAAVESSSSMSPLLFPVASPVDIVPRTNAPAVDIERSNSSNGKTIRNSTDYKHLSATSTSDTVAISFTNRRHQFDTNEDWLLSLRFRSIQPPDRDTVQQLHEEWFPVIYQDEFYDELVHGHMTATGDPLYTCVAVDDDKDSSFGNNNNDRIVACLVGSFVNARNLSETMQNLLVNDRVTHSRLFYIMTVGTVVKHAGLGTHLIQRCLQEQVEVDPSCGVVYLHVLCQNHAAIRMYEKLGFYRVQEIENYYNIDDVLHNCYLYAKYYHGTCVIEINITTDCLSWTLYGMERFPWTGMTIFSSHVFRFAPELMFP